MEEAVESKISIRKEEVYVGNVESTVSELEVEPATPSCCILCVFMFHSPYLYNILRFSGAGFSGAPPYLQRHASLSQVNF